MDELLQVMDFADMLDPAVTLTLPALRSAVAGGARASLLPLKAAAGRLRAISPFPPNLSGAYASYDEAMAAAVSRGLAGFDHDGVAEVAFEDMCKLVPWDYPVLFWLGRIIDDVDLLVDAGGHMGTKYRVFRELLPIDEKVRWVVYDLPAICRAGRRRALQDGLHRLDFVERIEEAGAPDLFLGSGLLQYLDIPLGELLGRLPRLPRHLLLNKVAIRKGPTVFSLQRQDKLRTPYQIRNEKDFLHEVAALGYQPVDRWTIPSLSHVIETHPELGASESAGFYFRLE